MGWHAMYARVAHQCIVSDIVCILFRLTVDTSQPWHQQSRMLPCYYVISCKPAAVSTLQVGNKLSELQSAPEPNKGAHKRRLLEIILPTVVGGILLLLAVVAVVAHNCQRRSSKRAPIGKTSAIDHIVGSHQSTPASPSSPCSEPGRPPLKTRSDVQAQVAVSHMGPRYLTA
jgi:hypothetical protein